MRYIRLIRKSTNHRLFPVRLPRLPMASPPMFASARVLEMSLVGRCPTDKSTQPCLAFVETTSPAREVAMAVIPRRLVYHRERCFRWRESSDRAGKRRMLRRLEQDRHTRLRRPQRRRRPTGETADFADRRAETKFLHVVE